jgi:tetratricopeptide (TPR) repeat protein
LGLVLAIGLLAFPVRAQRKGTGAPPSTESGPQEKARVAFANGERAFASAEYERALGEFEKAFSLVQHDAVRFNIAVCLEHLGRYREAAEQYDAAGASVVLKADDVERARRAATQARSHLGSLRVESGETGSPIRLNGQERCKIPCRIPLDPGHYEVTIGVDDRASRASLEISAGQEHELAGPAPPPTAVRPPVTIEPPAPAAPPPTLPASVPATNTARPGRSVGWLTWTGGGLALVGGAGTIYFGLRTASLHNEYVTYKTQEAYDDGLRSKDMTNVAIGVLAVGAALAVADLVFDLSGTKPRATAGGAGLRF